MQAMALSMSVKMGHEDEEDDEDEHNMFNIKSRLPQRRPNAAATMAEIV